MKKRTIAIITGAIVLAIIIVLLIVNGLNSDGANNGDEPVREVDTSEVVSTKESTEESDTEEETNDREDLDIDEVNEAAQEAKEFDPADLEIEERNAFPAEYYQNDPLTYQAEDFDPSVFKEKNTNNTEQPFVSPGKVDNTYKVGEEFRGRTYYYNDDSADAEPISVEDRFKVTKVYADEAIKSQSEDLYAYYKAAPKGYKVALLEIEAGVVDDGQDHDHVPTLIAGAVYDTTGAEIPQSYTMHAPTKNNLRYPEEGIDGGETMTYQLPITVLEDMGGTTVRLDLAYNVQDIYVELDKLTTE